MNDGERTEALRPFFAAFADVAAFAAFAEIVNGDDQPCLIYLHVVSLQACGVRGGGGAFLPPTGLDTLVGGEVGAPVGGNKGRGRSGKGGGQVRGKQLNGSD